MFSAGYTCLSLYSNMLFCALLIALFFTAELLMLVLLTWPYIPSLRQYLLLVNVI